MTEDEKKMVETLVGPSTEMMLTVSGTFNRLEVYIEDGKFVAKYPVFEQYQELKSTFNKMIEEIVELNKRASEGDNESNKSLEA